MKVIYEKPTDVLYFRAKWSKIEKTIKLNSHTLIDLDKAGNLVGIEVLDASKHVSKKLIKSSINLPQSLKTVTV